MSSWPTAPPRQFAAPVVVDARPVSAYAFGMDISFRKLHPLFAAEVTGIDLRQAHSQDALACLRGGMDEHAVLAFPDQPLTDADQLAFAQRLDGELHTKTGISALRKNRLGNEALADISNLSDQGEIMRPDDRRRAYSLANRLWHTDASFQDPPGRYSMLHARVIPPVGADTEFADMRAAYDALPEARKAGLEGLRVHHSIAFSRQTLGFDFSAEEKDRLRGAVHPLLRTLPRSGRKALYLASHANRILDWEIPDGRLLLLDLIEHATQRQFVYRHSWRVGDLVIWDNRCTMHRATPFEDERYRRELRRVTTLDVERGVHGADIAA
jgi:alpha-ketoglutarate-dependent 2,4-dichlorophenoxyacetate dioxygenase